MHKSQKVPIVFWGGLTAAYLCSSLCLAEEFPRRETRLYSNWKFYFGSRSGAESPAYNDASWETVSIPHPHQMVPVNGGRYDFSDSWYRRIISASELASCAGKKVYLKFEGAMQTCDVYVNGVKKTTHLGGYSPFVIDISSEVNAGGNLVIAARLNNSASELFPPGNDGPDFSYFGGLYRDVYLIVVDPLHITDPIFANKVGGGGIFITYPAVTSASATVQVKTHVINEYSNTRNCLLKTQIVDAGGSVVATAETSASIAAGKDTTFTQQIVVSNPRLWHPNSPNLYKAVSMVYDGTRPADMVTTTFGIRTIKFTKANGFEINGSRFIFHGANRHQEYPLVGNSVPASGHYRDALRMKESGFDFVRTCHYTQPPAFFDACDRLGIMAMVCLAGWQHWSGNQSFFDNSIAEVRAMIRWHRNHPSVILWEVIHNETFPPANYCTAAHNAAHAEYPGDQMYTCGEEGNSILDVYMSSSQHGVRGYSGSKPAQISEYGDWDYGGFESTSRVSRASGEAALLRQCANHIESLNANRALSWLSGDAVWSMFDYQGFQRPLRSGVQDIYRLPKFSSFFYRSQRDPDVAVPGANLGPMVFIASHWTAQSNLSVKVFSNCEQVSLYKNNVLIATQGPDQGSSVSKLKHPPFTFAAGPFVAGELKAEGKIGGVVRATHIVRTPQTPTKLVVTIDTANQALLADGADFAIVYASIVDANGTVVPTAANQVTFSVSGAGTIYGTNPIAAEAGIATILVKSQTTPGAITVTAKASGLADGTASITSVDAPATQTGTTGGARRNPPRRGSRMDGGNSGDVSRSSTDAIVRLYDSHGRLVYGGNVGRDASMLAAGVYHSEIMRSDAAKKLQTILHSVR